MKKLKKEVTRKTKVKKTEFRKSEVKKYENPMSMNGLLLLFNVIVLVGLLAFVVKIPSNNQTLENKEVVSLVSSDAMAKQLSENRKQEIVFAEISSPTKVTQVGLDLR